MTLFFDIIKLESEADGRDSKFMAILEDYYEVQVNNRLPRLKYKPLRGKSWLLNPVPLFNHCRADLAHIVQYIKLAGRRDYFLYQTYNIITLDISLYPHIFIESIERNPLLYINSNNIHFKFEHIYFEAKLNKTKGNLNGS